MSDNVIWGTDFRAKPAQQLCSHNDDLIAYSIMHPELVCGLDPDTAPSDYTAPDGDCA